MRAEACVGIAVIVFGPAILIVAHFAAVLPDLNATIGQIIISIVPAMIVGGASLVWFGRKPDAQELSRKQDIHGAIKKWVELPIVKFRDKQDALPLAEKPPELAVEIEQCLSRKYRSTVYASLQKLRQEYHDWKDTDSSAQFIKYEEGHAILKYKDLLDWDDFKAGELTRLHSQTKEQINSEIVEKHFTRLKC